MRETYKFVFCDPNNGHYERYWIVETNVNMNIFHICDSKCSPTRFSSTGVKCFCNELRNFYYDKEGIIVNILTEEEEGLKERPLNLPIYTGISGNY